MVSVDFEHYGDNVGKLIIVTHFGHRYMITCTKGQDEIFRLGGTAINAVSTYEGIVLDIQPSGALFRAYDTSEHYFETIGVLAPQGFKNNEHGYITEYYDLNAEEKTSNWIITREPLVDNNLLFINVDILDGGGNIIKRYRASPFFEEYKIINGFN